MSAVIEARDLSLVFQTADGPVHALSDVSLTINAGEFVSFIGPSGCGKTTFLRVVADLEQPSSGAISVNGMSPEAARRARAYGYVFQAAGLYPWRSIAGNVRLPLEIKDLFAEWLEDVTPNRAARVMKIIRDMRGGKDYDAEWGKRMTGAGPYAWTISRRFALAMDRCGLSRQRLPLRTDLFEVPGGAPKQLALL